MILKASGNSLKSQHAVWDPLVYYLYISSSPSNFAKEGLSVCISKRLVLHPSQKLLLIVFLVCQQLSFYSQQATSCYVVDVQMVILSPLDPVVGRFSKQWPFQPAKHSVKGHSIS